MHIGEKIRELRKSKGITQKELADALFVSRSTVAKWENGLGAPGESSFQSLCAFFGVEREALDESAPSASAQSGAGSAWLTWLAVFLSVVLAGTASVGLLARKPVFVWDIGGDYVDRWDGYCAAVYQETVCGLKVDGEDSLAMGNCSDITDFAWKHEELLGVVPYRRILCFVRETEPEIYFLRSEDGTASYGFMYVIRTAKGPIHYYYRRSFISGIPCSPYLMAENVPFSCDEGALVTDHYCHFSADADFTGPEDVLYIGGEPVCFVWAGER